MVYKLYKFGIIGNTDIIEGGARFRFAAVKPIFFFYRQKME